MTLTTGRPASAAAGATLPSMNAVEETRLREAQTRAHVAENVLDAAAVLVDAGVPSSSPDAPRLFDELVHLPDANAMRAHVARLREAAPPARRTYTKAARELLAKEGKARPDGSYPIQNVRDVEHAVEDFGRSNGSDEDKQHIIACAQEVPGGTDKLPADWSGSTRLQESARRLQVLGIPTLDDAALGPVRLREAASAADLVQLAGVPMIEPGQPAPSAGALAGLPMLPSTPGAAGLRYAPFTESVSGTIVGRVAGT